jgi:predicted RNA-binding Zn-ribbon protein involved in translation (DUF1610 family)
MSPAKPLRTELCPCNAAHIMRIPPDWDLVKLPCPSCQSKKTWLTARTNAPTNYAKCAACGMFFWHDGTTLVEVSLELWDYVNQV